MLHRFAIFAAVLIAAFFTFDSTWAAERPNIVFILADDLGYGDVNCYNAESKIPTPNLDALAAQGMRFTDAHSPCTVCTPTRYSLMTGQIDYSRPITGGPIDCGFDQFFGTACCPTTDWPYAFIDGNKIPIPPTKQLDRGPLPKHPYANDNRPGMVAPDFDVQEVDIKFLEKSKQFLQNHVKETPGKPFFLFIRLKQFIFLHFREINSKERQTRVRMVTLSSSWTTSLAN